MDVGCDVTRKRAPTSEINRATVTRLSSTLSSVMDIIGPVVSRCCQRAWGRRINCCRVYLGTLRRSRACPVGTNVSEATGQPSERPEQGGVHAAILPSCETDSPMGVCTRKSATLVGESKGGTHCLFLRRGCQTLPEADRLSRGRLSRGCGDGGDRNSRKVGLCQFLVAD